MGVILRSGEQIMTCDLCNKEVPERTLQEQCNYSLCNSCVDYHTDEELIEKMEIDND